MGMHRFRELKIGQRRMDLAANVYRVVAGFPTEEKYVHITTINLHTNEKTPMCIPVKLPKTTLRRKIKLCVDILFDRTYKR